VKAFSYVEYWRHCSLEVVENLGRTASERHVQTIFRAIQKTNGVSRSEVMQRYHLDARNAEMVLMTLEQRGLISRRKSGRTELLYANAIPEHTRREP
jgi:ribosomal protein S25